MPIDFVVEDRIALITINRPDRMNALDAEHYRWLSDAWIRVRDDNEIRVAIITGAGNRAFTVGADLKSYVPQPVDLPEMWLTQREQLLVQEDTGRQLRRHCASRYAHVPRDGHR